MFRVYFAVFLVALTCTLMSFEVEGQSTTGLDGQSETCGLLYTSEQIADLIRRGVEKVIASNQQQPKDNPVESSKQSLISALVCEYTFRILSRFVYNCVYFSIMTMLTHSLHY